MRVLMCNFEPGSPWSRRARRSAAHGWLQLGLPAAGLLALGCLPGDTRPPPARVLVNAQPSDSLLAGIPATATEDGWAIEYQRFLLGLGRVSLAGDLCTTYADADYTRVLDMLLPDTQKVSEQFALGSCDFGFGVAPPAEDSPLGEGVSEDDRARLRSPAMSPALPPRGISVYAQGQATRGDATEHFAWEFRLRVSYQDCYATLDGEQVSGLQLTSGEEQPVEIQISGDALFRDDPDPALAKLRFDAFAAADQKSGNADGDISLEELRQVKLANLAEGTAYQRVGIPDPSDVTPFTAAQPTLEDYLYASAFPGVARFRENGSCTIRVRARPQNFE